MAMGRLTLHRGFKLEVNTSGSNSGSDSDSDSDVSSFSKALD